MALINLFRPKWQHNDENIRLKAVKRLKNIKALVWVAENDKSGHIVDEAARKLIDLIIWDQNNKYKMRDMVKKNEDALWIAANKLDAEKSQELLAKIAITDLCYSAFCRYQISERAVERIEDQELLIKIAHEAEGSRPHELAAAKLRPESLERYLISFTPDQERAKAYHIALETYINLGNKPPNELRSTLAKISQSRFNKDGFDLATLVNYAQKILCDYPYEFSIEESLACAKKGSGAHIGSLVEQKVDSPEFIKILADYIDGEECRKIEGFRVMYIEYLGSLGVKAKPVLGILKNIKNRTVSIRRVTMNDFKEQMELAGDVPGLMIPLQEKVLRGDTVSYGEHIPDSVRAALEVAIKKIEQA